MAAMDLSFCYKSPTFMCVLSIKVPTQKSLETYLMIIVYTKHMIFKYIL